MPDDLGHLEAEVMRRIARYKSPVRFIEGQDTLYVRVREGYCVSVRFPATTLRLFEVAQRINQELMIEAGPDPIILAMYALSIMS